MKILCCVPCSCVQELSCIRWPCPTWHPVGLHKTLLAVAYCGQDTQPGQQAQPETQQRRWGWLLSLCDPIRSSLGPRMTSPHKCSNYSLG